jgi:DNA-binding transcriptional LysR family regulator
MPSLELGDPMPVQGRKRRHGVENWEDLRYVLTVVQEGSYSAAARKLRRDHSTVRRRVEATQRALGIKLFQRTRHAMRLTSQAAQIIDALSAMAETAAEIERRFAGVDARLAGTVRITTSEGFAAHWLVPRLVRFQRENPLIRFEFDASTRVQNLAGDDADIAIRFVRPSQPNLISVKAGKLVFVLFAARSYVDTFGRPDSFQSLNNHRLVINRAMINNPLLRRWRDYAADHPGIVVESETSPLFEASVVAGFGVGLAPLYTAQVYPELEVLPIPPVGETDIWLVTHSSKRRIPRVAAAFEFLRETFSADRTALFSDALLGGRKGNGGRT